MSYQRIRRLRFLVALWLVLSGLGFRPAAAQESTSSPTPDEVFNLIGVGTDYYDACKRFGGYFSPEPPGAKVVLDDALYLPSITFDVPVSKGYETSWLFGGYTVFRLEPYREGQIAWNCRNAPPSISGVRVVMYTEKGRIELTQYPPPENWPWDEAPPTQPVITSNGGVLPPERYRLYFSQWTPDPPMVWRRGLTAGNLARELLTGQLQIGDNTFIQREPAAIPAVGDPDGGGVTYAALGKVMDHGSHFEGEQVIQTIDAEGRLKLDPILAHYNVTYLNIRAPTFPEHSVASVFWEFFHRPGWQARDIAKIEFSFHPREHYVQYHFTLRQAAQRFDWVWLVGWPITEPYWTRAKVAGVEQWVLVQCFERRCLTYTPANPPGWQVEMGNIGSHYLSWRYGIDLDSSHAPIPQWPEFQFATAPMN